MTELTPQQTKALDRIGDWHAATGIGIDPFRLFGPAGTGKTTLAREVAGALGLSRVHFAAYTGKAAHVLRSKGCAPAGTLHSLIYLPMSNREAKHALEAARTELQDALERGEGQDWIDDAQHEIEDLERQVHTIGWEWNPESALADAELLILDEVSMVDAKLAADIERYEVPVLVLGDPEQLEPVGGEGYYTMAEPDCLLTEIHRQALDSPVLELATRIRQSADARLGMTEADLSKRSLAMAMEADQILCWKNGTRWNLVNKIRAALGRPTGQVVAGDRIMCLTNNRSIGVFNGQQFDVLNARPGALGPEMEVRDDQGNVRRLTAYAAGFEGRAAQDAAKQAYLGGRGNRMLATFANAITVHKAQGSEWDSVYVVNESMDLIDMTARREGRAAGIQAGRRLMYTAVTRASKSITVSAV